MTTDEQLHRLWNSICRQVKAASDEMPLWRAMDSAVPVTVEGTTIIIGFDEQHLPEARFLELPGNRAVVDRIMTGVATKPLDLLVIDGTTMEEYEHYKQRRAAAAELAAKGRSHALSEHAEDTGPFHSEAHRDATDSSRLLSDLQRRLHHHFVELNARGQTLVKAMFLRSALPQLLEAERQLALYETHEEAFNRHWSRALERVAEIADADPVTFAVMYLNYKDRQQS